MPKTPHFEWETPSLEDEADPPADLLSLAEEIEAELNGLPVAELGTAGAGDSGKFLIVNETGEAVWRALGGDAALAATGSMTIVNEAVTAAKLAALAVTEAKLAGESVATSKIANLAVTAAKLAAEAVETAKIKNLAVTEGKLAALAVSTSKLAEAAVTADKIGTTAAEQLGLSQTGTVRRGKAIIPTEEKRKNPAYGLLTTPDEVANVVLPTDGFIAVMYMALWREANQSASAAAAIHLDGEQVYIADVDSGNVVAPATLGIKDRWKPLTTFAGGLQSTGEGIPGATETTAFKSTGQIVGARDGTVEAAVGGPCFIFATAGTYDVSIRFSCVEVGGGEVVVKERRLWVWTMGF